MKQCHLHVRRGGVRGETAKCLGNCLEPSLVGEVLPLHLEVKVDGLVQLASVLQLEHRNCSRHSPRDEGEDGGRVLGHGSTAFHMIGLLRSIQQRLTSDRYIYYIILMFICQVIQHSL